MRPVYEARLAARRSEAERHDREFKTLGNLRLLVALVAAAVLWWNFWLLPIPAAAFVALLIIHERVDRRRTFERRAITHYQRALDRLDNRWAGTGESGERFRDPKHPYAEDLDVFGHGSLFQLISTARTAAGEQTLAGWLSAPSNSGAVQQRQLAIDELRWRLDLREDLALLGEDIRAELHPEVLVRWGQRPPEKITAGVRIAVGAVGAITAVTALGGLFQLWGVSPFLLALLANLLVTYFLRPRVENILAAVELPARDLRLLSGMLARWEREPFSSERLVALKKELETSGLSPSHQIDKLTTLIERLDWARNMIFGLIAQLLLWRIQLAFAIEKWRQVSGSAIGRWLQAVGEMEALSSLAAYAAEHPDDSFPEFAAEAPLFDGVGVAHPLLPSDVAIRNDVRLHSKMSLLLVSGSNMSGKSTLLRSVGLNTVLAWAGAPVRAQRLRLSPLQVGAAMRVQDSLLDGKSRFYAEITRIRQVVDLASGNAPLLFLLDELLSGTNSHDRRIGAQAIVRSLVASGAIGLVTTHDLALAHIAEELAPRAMNVHFEDHIENGAIAFDYRMRDGIVQKSNALELMRSVGLDV